MKKITAISLSSILMGVALVVVGSGASVSAEDCVRSNPTVSVTSAATQSGDPGETLRYTMNVTNNDSLGCFNSDFTFSQYNIPFDWSGSITPNTPVTVEPQQSYSFSADYISSEYAPGGAYSLTVITSKHYNDPASTEEDLLTHTYLTYKVLATPPPSTPTPTPVIPSPTTTPTPVLDTAAPSVTIHSPSDGSTVQKNSTVSITATASDNVGVTELYYRVNGQTLCSGVGTTSCAWQTGKRGFNQITVTAYDAAGNSKTAAVSVFVR
jgi:hypothetical protein